MKPYLLLFLPLLLLTTHCAKEENNPSPSLPISSSGSGSISIIQDEVNGQKIVLAGNPFHGFIVSFERTLAGFCRNEMGGLAKGLSDGEF